VSWQDRRAEPWCAAQAGRARGLAAATGLVLSPHYAGPKLAFMLAAEPALALGMAAGELLFGTLDSYLIWTWSGGRVHRVDLSMAARTMLVPFGGADWGGDLLETFGVPRAALPAIGPSAAPIDLGDGIRLAATVADQAAGMLALSAGPDTALVNLGTGGFVLLPVGARKRAPTGFLAGPLTGIATDGGVCPGTLALEGTINGIGPALEGLGEGPTELADADPAPDAFCLPDSTGVGAPHWRAAPPRRWSEAGTMLPDDVRRRVFLEGVVFRVREIVEGMAPRRRPHTLVLAGGMAEEPFIGPALAACTGLAVARLVEPEATLMGAARLAAGLPAGGAETVPVAPAGGAYLADKYGRWRAWMRAVLAP
jgi:glycerol kinase